MTHGSPVWQGGIFLVALLFLFWEAWRGWRAGLVRSGLNLAAIVVSGLVLYFGAQIGAAPFGGLTTTAGFFAGLAVGGGLGFVSFALIWLLGALLFKRTEHQGSGLIRFFWGVGGAVFGLMLGLVLLWGGISIIRLLGVLAESRMADAHPVSQIEIISESGAVPLPTPAQESRAERMATTLVKLKKSLELGPTGKFVESVDFVSPDVYEVTYQMSRITQNPEAMQRFLQYPSVQKVIQSPLMADFLNDPTVIKASEERNIPALMANKALIKAATDPALAELLKQVDLPAALKFALETPPPSPSPSPRSSP